MAICYTTYGIGLSPRASLGLRWGFSCVSISLSDTGSMRCLAHLISILHGERAPEKSYFRAEEQRSIAK